MKSWLTAAIFLCVGCIAALLYLPVLTGTWIVNNNGTGNIKAIVFTVGFSQSGPVVSLQHLSAPREDEVYTEIHAAARAAQYGASMGGSSPDVRHWGGGRSWCNSGHCRRLYIVVGSSLRRAQNKVPSASCSLPAAAGLESARSA